MLLSTGVTFGMLSVGSAVGSGVGVGSSAWPFWLTVRFGVGCGSGMPWSWPWCRLPPFLFLLPSSELLGSVCL